MTEPKVVRKHSITCQLCAEHMNGLMNTSQDSRNCDVCRLAAYVQELEELAEWRAQAMDRRERVVKTQDAEIARLREALEYSRKMEMKDGNISGEFYQVVDEALEEKP